MTRRIVIILFISIVAATSVFGEDYWFSQDGDDSAVVCSQATPWNSLSKLNSTDFQPGDTIRFRRGDTWVIGPDEDGMVIDFNGTESQRIVISAYGSGALPTIDASAQTGDGSRSGTTENCIYIGAGNGNHVTIESLDLRGAQGELIINGYGNECADHLTIQNCVFSGSGFAGEAMINLYGGTDRIIRQNEFHADSGYNKCIELSGATHSLISGNLFYHAMSSGGAIRLVFGHSTIIENNYIEGASPGQASNWGIVVRSIHEGTTPWIVVRNNIINAHGVSLNPRGITGWDDDVHRSPDGKRTYVLNNTIYGSGSGEAVKFYDTGWIIENNIIANWYQAYDQSEPDAYVEISNNAHWDITTLSEIEGPDVFIDHGNHVEASPRLDMNGVPDTPEAFKLMEGSPCINQGIAGPFSPATDFWGTTRQAIDIGAHEYTSPDSAGNDPPEDADTTHTDVSHASNDATCFISSAKE